MEKPVKILLIEDNPGDARLIREMLSGLPQAPVEIESADRLATGLVRLAQGGLDAALLDLSLPDSSGYDSFAKVHAAAPQLPIVVLTGLDDEGLAIRTVRDGAQDYVLKGGLTGPTLARTVRFAMERQKMRLERLPGSRRAEPGRILGFLGAKGGVGTTTVALNVAAILAQQAKAVIALEPHTYQGGFAWQLRHTPNRHFGDLLALDPAGLSASELGAHLAHLPCGIQALFAPQQPRDFVNLEPEPLQAVIRAAAEIADYVVLDLPAPCHATQVALLECDSILLVVTRDHTSVIAGKAMVELLKSWEIAENDIGAVVISNNPIGSFLSLSDLHNQLGCGIVAVISPAAERCAASYRMGVPLVLSEPECLASANLTELANRLAAPVLVPVAA